MPGSRRVGRPLQGALNRQLEAKNGRCAGLLSTELDRFRNSKLRLGTGSGTGAGRCAGQVAGWVRDGCWEPDLGSGERGSGQCF